jgi:hypothetical protein
MDDIDRRSKRLRIIAAIVCSEVAAGGPANKFRVEGRRRNRLDADYNKVVDKINHLKEHKGVLFTRMYRLSPASFDKVLRIIEPKLHPKKKTGSYFVPPVVKLCLGLRVLAGGSYLDLSFGYDVPPGSVHFYAWQAIHVLDQCTDPFLNNIRSPIHATAAELQELEHGFAQLSDFKLRGTVAAGDGIVFRMQMPTNEEVDGDVTSYFTRKGYYAYGLQVSLFFLPSFLFYLH